MSQISTVNGLSTNFYQNIELQKKYDKHINKIVQIGSHKPNIKTISQQQRKISQALKKSKQIAKSFKQKEFILKRQQQNKRLMKSLSQIQCRQKMKTEMDQSRSHFKKRVRTNVKEDIIRDFEIQRQNKKIANSILSNVVDVGTYKKKIQKEIAEYQRLKQHLQRLKPITTHRQKAFHELHQKEDKQPDLIKKKLKLQTQPHSQRPASKKESLVQPLRKTTEKLTTKS